MFEATGWAAPLLPAEQPRYFMGIGDAEGILRVIGAGIDMFDCVLPTRTARTGSALTATGRLNLRNARFARDPRPLEEGCTCPACTRFSRAYVRHLVNQEELLGLRLLSLHNLHFLLELTAGARAAIERGELEALTRPLRSPGSPAAHRRTLGTADRSRRHVRPALAALHRAAAPRAQAAAAADRGASRSATRS